MSSPEGITIPDVVGAHELDTLFDDVPQELFDGKTLEHELFGKLPLKCIDGRLFAEIEFSCNKPKCNSGLKYRCYLGSGLHSGAWCYAYNLNTREYEACVRDQIYVCAECKRKTQS